MSTVLNDHLQGMKAAGLSTRPCSSFSIAELQDVEKLLLGVRSPELQAVYEQNGDNRMLTAAQLQQQQHAVDTIPADLQEMVRDGKCHAAVMMYVHHIAENDKPQVHELVTLPLLPSADHRTIRKNSGGDELREKLVGEYHSAVSCASCHTSVATVASTTSTITKSNAKSTDPAVPIWGGALAWSAHINLTNPSDSPTHPNWGFNYYYDASQSWTVSRYEFDQTQHDEVCGLESGHSGRCNIIHATDKWMYITFPDEGFCCKCTQGIGAVLSKWLFTDTTYKGPTTVAGVAVDEWLKYGASDNHYYATTDQVQKPIRYMEHKNGKLKQWDFETYSPEAQNRSLFAPPCTNRCTSLKCKTI
jgi:hypothetical protein